MLKYMGYIALLLFLPWCQICYGELWNFSSVRSYWCLCTRLFLQAQIQRRKERKQKVRWGFGWWGDVMVHRSHWPVLAESWVRWLSSHLILKSLFHNKKFSLNHTNERVCLWSSRGPNNKFYTWFNLLNELLLHSYLRIFRHTCAHVQ